MRRAGYLLPAALAACLALGAIALFLSGPLTTRAVQNPRISLDMDPAGNSYDAATNTMTVGEGDVLTVNRRHPSNPKDTRAFVMLGRYVVKDYSGFTLYLLGIKRIFHQQEDIDIVRLALRRHKGPKNDEPCQLSRTACQSIDTNQPLRHETPLQCTRPKMCDHFREGGAVNAYRQVAIAIKVWPLLHWQMLWYLWFDTFTLQP